MVLTLILQNEGARINLTDTDFLLFLWVILGSALGGMARYWLSGLVARGFGETFPWGTMVVNVSGAFLIGVLFGLAAVMPGVNQHPEILPFLVVGFLGSYTTVSSFSFQTLTLLHDRQWFHAGVNVFGTTGLCLLAVWLGFEFGAAYA